MSLATNIGTKTGNQYNSTFGTSFTRTPMGLGTIGNPDLVFKRKYRWSFTIKPYCSEIGIIPSAFVKLASRPNLTVEETEINFLHGKMYIPGKATWETLTVTYYDVGGKSSYGPELFRWLATTFNFLDPVGLQQSSRRGGAGSTQGYAAQGLLLLYDGCGSPMEEWSLDHMWPQAINFGELDFSSSEEVTIELTLRFSECRYTNICGRQIQPPCCGGCN